MRFIFALALVVVAATTSPKDQFPRDAQGLPIRPGSNLNNPDICARGGGTWQEIGLGQQLCVISAPDAGKSCNDSSECGGSCLVELSRKVSAGAKVTGSCSSHYVAWGCLQIVGHGRAGEAICI